MCGAVEVRPCETETFVVTAFWGWQTSISCLRFSCDIGNHHWMACVCPFIGQNWCGVTKSMHFIIKENWICVVFFLQQFYISGCDWRALSICDESDLWSFEECRFLLCFLLSRLSFSSTLTYERYVSAERLSCSSMYGLVHHNHNHAQVSRYFRPYVHVNILGL